MTSQSQRAFCLMTSQLHKASCLMTSQLHRASCLMTSQSHRASSLMTSQSHRASCLMTSQSHRASCLMTSQLHRASCFMNSPFSPEAKHSRLAALSWRSEQLGSGREKYKPAFIVDRSCARAEQMMTKTKHILETKEKMHRVVSSLQNRFGNIYVSFS